MRLVSVVGHGSSLYCWLWVVGGLRASGPQPLKAIPAKAFTTMGIDLAKRACPRGVAALSKGPG